MVPRGGGRRPRPYPAVFVPLLMQPRPKTGISDAQNPQLIDFTIKGLPTVSDHTLLLVATSAIPSARSRAGLSQRTDALQIPLRFTQSLQARLHEKDGTARAERHQR
jgi:hypothetical protein